MGYIRSHKQDEASKEKAGGGGWGGAEGKVSISLDGCLSAALNARSGSDSLQIKNSLEVKR